MSKHCEMRSMEGRRGKSPYILNLGIRRSVVSIMLRWLYPRNPLVRSLDRHKNLSGCCSEEKILTSNWNRTTPSKG